MRWHSEREQNTYHCFGWDGSNLREQAAINSIRHAGLMDAETFSMPQVVMVLENFYGSQSKVREVPPCATLMYAFHWDEVGGSELHDALSENNLWHGRNVLTARDMYDLFHRVIHGKWPIHEEKSETEEEPKSDLRVRTEGTFKKVLKPFVVTKPAHELAVGSRPDLLPGNMEKFGGKGKDKTIPKPVPIRDNSGLFTALAAVNDARRFDGRPPEHEDHAMLANRKGIK